MKLIIDTDMGIDDAIALLMALAHPETEIEALTTVVGNVPLVQATLNTGVVLDIAEAPPIPIYRGCARPLMQNDPLHALEVHATDGLGGAGRTETSRSIEAEHASPALTRLAHEQSGQLTLLTLGPLTNIALALRLDPNFLTHFERVVMMAAAVDGRGNTSPSAEFNIAVDPEAAKIVFDACQSVAERVWLVSWEASLTHATPFADWREMIEGDSPVIQFVQGMSVYIEQAMAQWGATTIPWADPLAAAVALRPDIVTTSDRRPITVETSHNLARGQTIVDYRPNSQRPLTANIVRSVDELKFHELLRLMVK